MLCYDRSEQQHSLHRQIKRQHLFLLLVRHYYLLLGADPLGFSLFGEKLLLEIFPSRGVSYR